MNPTPSSVHINVPLTNISIAYLQNQADFVADRVFPIVPVDKISDYYYTFDRGEFNRSQMKKRGHSVESAGGGYTVSNDTYLCDVFALHKDIDDKIRANTDSLLGPDRNATNWLTMQSMLNREVAFATDFLTTGVWTSILTGVAAAPSTNQALQWNDASSSPIENVRTAKKTVKQLTGFFPNKFVLGREVYDALCDHPDILDRIKGAATNGNPAVVNQTLLAQLFEVEQVMVMDAIQNTANEGQTASHSFIGGKKALLCYTPATPSIETPSAGYTFGWRGYMGGNMQAISRFRMEHLKSDRVEIEAAYDQKKTSADLGYFFNTIVA